MQINDSHADSYEGVNIGVFSHKKKSIFFYFFYGEIIALLILSGRKTIFTQVKLNAMYLTLSKLSLVLGESKSVPNPPQS